MNKKHLIIMIIAVIFMVLLDQVSKIIIINNLELGERITVIPNFFHIGHAKNTGISYGLFSNAGPLFYIVIYVLAVGVFVYLSKDINFTAKKMYSISLLMMISGGIGNLIDRIFLGEVTDFLILEIFGRELFGIFNIADVFLVVGMIVFAIDIIIEDVLKWKKSS